MRQIRQQQAQSVMMQLLNGYHDLFKMHVVHRDLKLANIFVTKGKVKIADFGFAIAADKCEHKFDYNVGSPYYMPPESLKFNRYSYKSDVWALGVIAYELVHGKMPWKDKNDAVLYDKIHSSPIELLIDPELKLSENYQNFIKRCLTLDYDRRANPNLIVSWPWNLAKPFVQGIEEKKKLLHHHSMNFNSGSLEEIPLENGEIAFKKKTVINSNVHLGDDKTQVIKALIEQDKKSKKAQGSPFAVEQVVLAQLHYCRFLSNLHDEMHRDKSTSEQWQPKLVRHGSLMENYENLQSVDHALDSMKSSIAERIINKIEVLCQIARTNLNLLKIAGFEAYTKTPMWEKLKGVIGQYRQKYYNQYKQKLNPFLQSKYSSPESIEQLLVSTIKQLKMTLNNHTKNLRLLELLTFYYQVLGLEKKNNPSNFAQVAKMDLLGSKQLYESVAIERLMKKLEYMGL